MGSAQSLLSPEAAITTAVVVGAVGYGIGYQVSKSESDRNEKKESAVGSGPPSVGIEGKAGKGKSKEKKVVTGSERGKSEAIDAYTIAATSKDAVIPTIVPFPAVVPGQFDDEHDDDVAVASGSHEPSTSAKKGKGKGGKKKKKVAGTEKEDVKSPNAQEQQRVVDDEPLVSSDPGPTLQHSKAKKQKKKKASSQPQSQELPPKSKPASTPKSSSTLHQSTISVDTDGEWTRVEKKKNVHDGHRLATSLSESSPALPSDNISVSTGTGGAITTDGEGDAEDEEDVNEGEGSRLQQSGQRKPLAERMLPKPRKTGVDDMLSTPDYPTLSRVMRIQPKPGEKPAAGFSWADYEDVVQGPAPSGGETADGEGDDDDGWGVVKRGGRPRPQPSASTSPSQHAPQKAPESLTKKQRQNAAKREAQKSAKAEAEVERQATLAKHKRELETERIKEQYRSGGAGKKGGMSGGMKATVDDKGKLIWE